MSIKLVWALKQALRSISIFLCLSSGVLAQHVHHTQHDGQWPPDELPALVSLPPNAQHIETSITVSSDKQRVQAFFNYGVIALHSYAYLEAYRSFDQALKLDPDLAMGYWGKAYSLLGFGKTGTTLDELIKNAIERLDGTSGVERKYIEALASYTRSDEDYISALEAVIEAHPGELDAKLLLAFFMNDGYDSLGRPKGRQAYAKALLAPLLNQYPQHIGLHHYWIHATEGSRFPERSLISVNVLEQAKLKLGHLTHMPGHIAWLAGNYNKAVQHFRAAEKIDVDYMQKMSVSLKDYWSYQHNIAYLLVAELEAGNRSAAKETAKRAQELYQSSASTSSAKSWRDFQFNYVSRITRRNGQWRATNELLESIPELSPNQRYQLAHSSVLSVLNTKGPELNKQLRRNAESALKELKSMAGDTSSDAARPFFQMLRFEAEAVVAAMNGDGKAAIKGFVEALKFEKNIAYDEPPLRVRSIRETAAQTFCRFGSYDIGASMYQDAIKLRQNNGFALIGLIDCMRNKGDAEAIKKYEALLSEVWPSHVPLTTNIGK